MIKTIRNGLMVSLTVLVLSNIQAEDKPAAQKDQVQLQGEWKMVSGRKGGYDVPETMVQTSKRECTGSETVVIVGGQLIMRAKFTLDPSKTPKTIDYIVLDGPERGRTNLGIYEIEGDVVKFCYSASGTPRPTEFASKPGDRRTFSVWARNKEAAGKSPSETK